MMYTKEQQERALKEFERLGSVQAVINLLGYPSRHTLYDWYRNYRANIQNHHGSLEKPYHIKERYINSPKHPRYPDIDFKLDVINRCFSLGEGVEYVSREIGYSRMSIYTWYRTYCKYGVAGLMSSKKQIKREKLSDQQIKLNASELQEQINKLQMEVDILKETINVLKKDPGINMAGMKNREKAVIIDALKNKYSLLSLLQYLCMPKSSYYYQESLLKRPDKYHDLHIQIKNIFVENKSCFGYRRIYGKLKRLGFIVSEKIIRRIMQSEGLFVPTKKTRKYSSYKGEISPEVNNIIARNFHAELPNEKWLTDITEFAIPAGKVYLSPIIDCFDGMVVSWNIGKNPNSILVNNMLDNAVKTLNANEHPIVHSDRGCHYRWPGWIERMRQAQLTRSMSQKGCSPDNSACEGFFGRLKNEMFYGRSWIDISIGDFISKINEYINWYNTKRIKQSLGFLSPVEYRQSLGLLA